MGTYSYSQTFTITNARYLASKIAADLKRMQRFYRYPNARDIKEYEEEITELLRHGYLRKVTYGFKREGKHIEPTLVYTAQELLTEFSTDDDPGRVRPGADTTGASFYTYLIYSEKWHSLSLEEQESFQESIPVRRTGADEPAIAGYLANDKTYSSGGRAVGRSSVRSF